MILEDFLMQYGAFRIKYNKEANCNIWCSVQRRRCPCEEWIESYWFSKSVTDKIRKEDVVVSVVLNLYRGKEEKREANYKEEMVKD